MSKLTIACIQNNATNIVADNIVTCSDLIREAAASGARFVATPEYFSGVEFVDKRLAPAAFEIDNHPVIDAFSELAQELSIDILLGSIGVKSRDDLILNQSVLVDSNGKVVQRYNKIHLFDVDLGEGKVYRESEVIEPGEEAKLATLGDMTLGLSICYDLRFPGLYRHLAQAGANVLCVPAAFTKTTGKAHWHTLLKARAIENACFVIAPNQFGYAVGGGPSYGHSLIIDPWGEVLADGGEEAGVITATIDLTQTDQCRAKIPSLLHDDQYTRENNDPALVSLMQG